MADDKKFAPLCIWCREPWSDSNIKAESIYASEGCDTCGYGSKVTGEIVITCHACKKEMYRKEF